MTYSCSDFTDSILERLKIDVPPACAESPEDQARFAIAAIDKIDADRATLLAALKDLAKQINLRKLNIRKDFDLLAVHAAALTAIHKAEQVTP